MDSEEVRVTNNCTGGQKGQKLARYDLIPPRALHALAEHYGRGAKKYADRNWEKGVNWSLNFAALQRHLWAFWGGEDNDEEGNSHLAAAMWHVAALIEYGHTHPGLDDRSIQPPWWDVADAFDGWDEVVEVEFNEDCPTDTAYPYNNKFVDLLPIDPDGFDQAFLEFLDWKDEQEGVGC